MILALLKGIGGAVISQLIPSLGNKIVKEVNDVLSDDDKVNPETVTGEELAKKVEQLPPETIAKLQESEAIREAMALQAKITESNNFVEIQRLLVESEQRGSRLRPTIVFICMLLVVYGIGIIFFKFTMLTWMVFFAEADRLLLVTTNLKLVPSTDEVLAAITFPTGLIAHYFGKRTIDKIVRAQALTGRSMSVPEGMVSKGLTFVKDKLTRKKS